MYQENEGQITQILDLAKQKTIVDICIRPNERVEFLMGNEWVKQPLIITADEFKGIVWILRANVPSIGTPFFFHHDEQRVKAMLSAPDSLAFRVLYRFDIANPATEGESR